MLALLTTWNPLEMTILCQTETFRIITHLKPNKTKQMKNKQKQKPLFSLSTQGLAFERLFYPRYKKTYPFANREDIAGLYYPPA